MKRLLVLLPSLFTAHRSLHTPFRQSETREKYVNNSYNVKVKEEKVVSKHKETDFWTEN